MLRAHGARPIGVEAAIGRHEYHADTRWRSPRARTGRATEGCRESISPRLATPLLAGGEEVVAGVRVNWNGMVPPARVPSAPRQMGNADDDAAVADPDALVAFPSAKQMALVLTGGRLLAWALGISGKPKQYLGEVPLSAVARVEAGHVRFGALIRVTLKSGAVVDLEALRGEPGEEFGEQLAYWPRRADVSPHTGRPRRASSRRR